MYKNPEQWQNDINHFMAISAFEGLYPTEKDKELYHLLCTGKISKDEYKKLCLEQAKPFIQ